MKYKFLALAPLLAVVASTAFAAGPDDSVQQPQLRQISARCDTNAGLTALFNPACDGTQTAVPVSAEVVLPKAKLRTVKAKRITQMPWQIGIFQ